MLLKHCFAGLTVAAALFTACCTGSDPVKPNIIIILADDLGYGDTGPFGQDKIETPNIDRLAESGMRFTRHYSGSPVCAPSRCVLMTGMHTGHAQIRGNDEWAERGDVWSYRSMLADSSLEGQRPLADGTVTLASILQKNGYITGSVGKWGLGAPHTGGAPGRQGFDFFYGYNCQRMAHTYYPVHLWRNGRRVTLRNDTVPPHTGFDTGADPYDPASYHKFNMTDYSPDLMFSEMITFIDSCGDKPFFLYWATPIPHLPLQAPDKWVRHYSEKFGDEEPYSGGDGYFPVRYPHATYAAMITYLDDQVGKLVSHLKEKGIYENTLILFTSDNGPAWNAGTDPVWFNSAGPFRGEQGYGKASVSEGGIRVPLIVTWPGMIEEGAVSEHISAFWDILPTLCEITRAELPPASDGISFLPELLGKPQPAHEYLYWEFPEYGGQQAVLIGKLKAIRRQMHNGNERFELYDLASDPREQKDIAAQNPAVITRVREIVAEEHKTSPNPKWRFTILD